MTIARHLPASRSPLPTTGLTAAPRWVRQQPFSQEVRRNPARRTRVSRTLGSESHTCCPATPTTGRVPPSLPLRSPRLPPGNPLPPPAPGPTAHRLHGPTTA